MINSAASRILPVIICFALGACADAKPRAATNADTVGSPVGASDSQNAAVAPRPVDVAPNAIVPPKVNVSSNAADVVRVYYAAISNRQYDPAYALWDGAGKASGQSRAEFENGFAQTQSVTVTVSDSVHIEGAAGSQYATVPVTVDATLRDGTVQHFTGTYTLRRSMVDGATAAQRSWHIYSAKLKPRS